MQHNTSKLTTEPYPKEEREQLGIDDQLVRFAIGIENKEDIIKDVEQALKKARH